MSLFDNPLIPAQNVPAAVVTIGEVETDGEPGKLKQLGSTRDQFTDFKVRNRYERDLHRYQLGLTTPNGFQGASCAFVQMAAPTLLWICDWTACRFRTPPIVPDPETLVENWVLLDVLPETASLGVGPDGATPLYRISGTYVYGHRNPSGDVFRDIAFPRPPWLEDVFDRSMPDNLLEKGLSEATSTGGAAAIVSPGMNARVI